MLTARRIDAQSLLHTRATGLRRGGPLPGAQLSYFFPQLLASFDFRLFSSLLSASRPADRPSETAILFLRLPNIAMLRAPLIAVAATLWWSSLVAAHTVITYPGWRGNNLHTNGTNPDGTVPEGSIGIDYMGNDTYGFPYGMQWMYPCQYSPSSGLTPR